jgi:predicted house-cleaning NTP pyrophosphatase (Maf/HAM1 superfamily)
MILEHVQKLSSQRVILASASPRRRDILQNVGLHAKVSRLVRNAKAILDHRRAIKSALVSLSSKKQAMDM